MANTYVWKIVDLNRDLSDGFAHAEKVTEIQDALAARIAKQITPTEASGTPSGW